MEADSESKAIGTADVIEIEIAGKKKVFEAELDEVKDDEIFTAHKKLKLTENEQLGKELSGGWAPVKKEYLLPNKQVDVESDKPDRAIETETNRSKPYDYESKKGMNRDRPHEDRFDYKTVLCLKHCNGNCSFGDGCKYNHDIKNFLAQKPKDIGLSCPVWDVKGFCPAGLNCRWGSSHTDTENLVSIVKEGVTVDKGFTSELTESTRKLCWKNKYPYKCETEDFKQYLRNLELDYFPKKDKFGVVKVTEPPVYPTHIYPERKKGTIDFEGKVYVAPLTTVGNLPFRRIMKKFGADITCGEMAVAKNLVLGQTSEWALLKRHSSEDIFGIQIAGGYADQMTRVAELVQNEIKFEFFDINMGCPLDIICDKGMGSGLMTRQNKIPGILCGLTSVLEVPVTVKMRAGWNLKDPLAHRIIPSIQKFAGKGLGAVMIHGRSRLQRYAKSADWDYIRKSAASQVDDFPKLPIIGNGDIFSYTDYEKQLEIGGDNMSTCAMIGRGALIKPWLPTEIKERRHWDISASERLDILKTFVNFGLEHWGSDQIGVNRTRRFLLEWLSFTCRYIPVGLLEVLPQRINDRPPNYCCRSDLETLLSSQNCKDWIQISEMLLGPVPEGFQFQPKHNSNSYAPLAAETQQRGPIESW